MLSMKLISAFVLVGWLCFDFLLVLGDIGTAEPYNPPYLPTRCNGNNPDQFPEGDMFVAVSNGLWDNGAACGRRYRMRCISGPCNAGLIVVTVVDVCRTNPCRANMLLSNRAFGAISRIPRTRINIEYAQI